MKLIRPLFVVITSATFACSAFAETAGMPQMDTTWFANQLVWLAISFTLLYLVVSRFVVPRVGGVLALRQTTISEAIAKAEAFKAHAAQARGEFESRASEVSGQVSAMIAAAQATAAQTNAAELVKLNTQLAAKEASADSRLTQAMQAAQPELEKATLEVAKAITEKLLGSSVDAATISNAIKNAA